MFDLKYINVANIPIGLHQSGPVGVSVSGGADSAALLYILMKNLDNDIYIYNFIADYRKHALEKPFDDVVAMCAKLTGKKNIFVRKEYVSSASPEYMFNRFTDIANSGEVDLIYFGLTKFPPTDVWTNWEEKLSWSHIRLREDGVTRPVFGISIPMPADDTLADPAITIDRKNREVVKADNRTYVPWVNYNKKDVAAIYRYLNIEDTLFSITRSCENDDHPDSHCGKCWWCNERLWGFGYLE